jgi:hypothetical protein
VAAFLCHQTLYFSKIQEIFNLSIPASIICWNRDATTTAAATTTASTTTSASTKAVDARSSADIVWSSADIVWSSADIVLSGKAILGAFALLLI